MITDKERAQMSHEIEKLASGYENTVLFYGRDSVTGKDALSMAENYRALAQALRERKPFEGWA